MRRRPLLLSFACLLLLGAAAGCSDPEGTGDEAAEALETSRGDAAAEIDRDLRDLITAVSPLRPDATAMAERDWYTRRTELLKRLREGSEELGQAALAAYRERPDALPDVRSALLDVAAHCAPEATRPVLVELVSTYGPDLGLRKNAARYLAETSPQAALELLAPIVATAEHHATYPPADQLLESYVIAMDAVGRDPVEMLATVATDIRQGEAARHYAVKELGKRPSNLGRQALEALLVESLGNNMLRRFAAQSLRSTLERDELCPLVRRVFENESDVDMQGFLASMLEANCL